MHKHKVHSRVRSFGCDHCNYTAYTLSLLRKHIIEKHEGRYKGVFQCDMCESKLSSKATLRQHKEMKHEGIKYTCDVCVYEVADKGKLVKHKKKNTHKSLIFEKIYSKI